MSKPVVLAAAAAAAAYYLYKNKQICSHYQVLDMVQVVALDLIK